MLARQTTRPASMAASAGRRAAKARDRDDDAVGLERGKFGHRVGARRRWRGPCGPRRSARGACGSGIGDHSELRAVALGDGGEGVGVPVRADPDEAEVPRADRREGGRADGSRGAEKDDPLRHHRPISARRPAEAVPSPTMLPRTKRREARHDQPVDAVHDASVAGNDRSCILDGEAALGGRLQEGPPPARRRPPPPRRGSPSPTAERRGRGRRWRRRASPATRPPRAPDHVFDGETLRQKPRAADAAADEDGRGVARPGDEEDEDDGAETVGPPCAAR